MKKLILAALMLASFSSFATEYSCYVSNFKLMFRADESMSELVVRDRETGEYVYSGYVDSILRFNQQVQFHFGKFKMSFKAEDLKNQEQDLFGFADGTFGRGFYNTTLRCVKD